MAKKIQFTIEVGSEYGNPYECYAALGVVNGENVVMMDVRQAGCANELAALTADDAEFVAICLQRMATALRNPK